MTSLIIGNRAKILLGIGLAIFLFFGLAKVFAGDIVLSQGFQIGPLFVRYYGVLLFLAVVMAYRLAQYRADSIGLTANQTEQIFYVLIVSGLVGARMYHVFSEWWYYRDHLGQMISIWQGGLSIYGAVIGGLIGLVVYLRILKSDLTIWRLLDWLAPSLALGQIIGRFGNLFNYEAYGLPTSLPWKMYVPEDFRLFPYELNPYFHPTFLYESIGCSLILFVLLSYPKKFPGRGGLFLGWLLMYNLMRFFTEQLRTDSVFIGSFRLNMWFSAMLVLIAVLVLVHRNVQKNTLNH